MATSGEDCLAAGGYHDSVDLDGFTLPPHSDVVHAFAGVQQLEQLAFVTLVEPVDQLRPADEPDASGRGVLFEKLPVAQALDDDGFRHG